MNSICTDIKSNATEISVGTILKQARQNHKIRDLNVIAEELCIRSHLLEALEQGNFNSFPSSCYATGFLKNYASYLGLDTKDVVSRYEAEYTGSNECVVLDFPEVEKFNRLPLKSLAGIATLSIAIFIGVWSNQDRLDAEETIVTFAPTNLHSSNTVTGTVSSPEPVVSEPIAVMSDQIRLEATQDVWVRLLDSDGTVRVEKILAKGEELLAPTDEGLTLMTNNAAALSIYVDGDTAVVLGRDGEIIEGIRLEQEKLLELSMLH